MKIVTLLENTSRRPGLTPARGLSFYVETARRKVLFDMGPDASFLENARALGIDLAAVDTAVLSHGHSNHGGGLAAFCAVNGKAKIHLRREALGAYYAVLPGQEPNYIGLPETKALAERFVFTGDREDLGRGRRGLSVGKRPGGGCAKGGGYHCHCWDGGRKYCRHLGPGSLDR